MTATSVAIPQSNEGERISRTTLHGARLWLARATWFAVAVSSLGMTALLLPLILRMSDYGDWQIERTAQLFGINIFSPSFELYGLVLLGSKYAAVAIFVGVACYIFWRKSNDWMAILVSIMLLVLPHTFNLVGYTDNWYLYRFPLDKLLYTLDGFYNGFGSVFLFLVFFLFPDGRFVPRWTRWFAFLSLVLVAAIWLSQIFESENSWIGFDLWLPLILFFLGLLLLVTWSQIHRYRHVSTPAQQTQTRLVVLSLVVIVASFLMLIPIMLGLTSVLDTPIGALANLLVSTFVLTLLPLAFGVAMLRDQLWQSERVLNRAVVYAALTAILLVVYVLVIAALSEVFRATNNFLSAAVATGVVALLFQPLRARLQRGINRFLYGQRDEPFTVVNHLGTQLENSIAPADALPLIVETIVKNMRVPYAELKLTTDDIQQPTLTHYPPSAVRRPSSELFMLPLRYQNETVGELFIGRRAPNENFSPADMQLLNNLARHAGAAAYTARLYAQLQQSRETIITERENERKRLRRDLHDGLGPTLASQTLKLDAAMEFLDDERRDTRNARKILQELKAQTQNTVAEIRRIVYELRPPALDDLGLVGALRAHLAQYNGAMGLQIAFDAPEQLPPLSAAVQVNAYRIVTEAVNNVMKHANATRCSVRIFENGSLKLEITDNGVGMPKDFRAGVGVTTMRERAEELGGTFDIEPNVPHGTRVIATLPIDMEAGRQGNS